MTPQKYRFLLGSYNTVISNFSAGGIDDSGIDTNDLTKVSSAGFILDDTLVSDTPPLHSITHLISDIAAPVGDSYAAVLFYTANNTFLGLQPLAGKGFHSIALPSGAQVARIRLTASFYEETVKPVGGAILYRAYLASPHYSQLAKTWRKEDEQQFFRTDLEGELKFVGKDSDEIATSRFDTSFALMLQGYDEQQGWEDYHLSGFYKKDCEINVDNRIVTPKLTKLDRYTKVLAKYDDEHDLIKVGTPNTPLSVYVRPLIQLYRLGDNRISNYIGGTWVESDCTEVSDTNELTEKYCFGGVKDCSMLSVREDSNPSFNSNVWGDYEYSSDDLNDTYDGTPASSFNYRGSYKKLPLDLVRVKTVRVSGSNAVRFFRLVGLNASGGKDFVSGEAVFAGLSGDYPSDLPLPSDKWTITNGGNDSWATTYEVRYFGRVALGSIDRFSLGGSSKQTYDLPADDLFFQGNRNYRKCVKMIDFLSYTAYEGADGFVLSDIGGIRRSFSVLATPTEYGIRDVGEYFTNTDLPPAGGLDGLRPLPLAKSSWGSYSVWYDMPKDYIALDRDNRARNKSRAAHTLADTIASLLRKIDPSITHQATSVYSEFLYGSDSYCDLVLTQITNIKKSDHTQAAQKEPITLQSITDMLRDQYKLYWFIDEQNRFRIEQLRWFMLGGSYTTPPPIQLDATSLIDAMNKKRTVCFQNTVSFDFDGLFKRLEKGYGDHLLEWFDQLTYDIKDSYAQELDTSSVDISGFSFDIDGLLIQPSSFSDDGFALIGVGRYDVLGRVVNSEIIRKLTIGNTDMQGDYYRRDVIVGNPTLSQLWRPDNLRVGIAGATVASDTPRIVTHLGFTRLAKSMVQSIRLATKDDLDEQQLVKTDLGNGQIESISIDITSRTADIELRFEPR